MPVLCYHTVDPSWTSSLSMAPSTFAEHGAWLARHRKVVDLETAVALMDRRGRLPRGTVALTFDDGLAGLYDHALPVLRSLGLPATVFVVAKTLLGGDRTVDWIDDPPQHSLDTLTLEQLQEMQECGIAIGSHSMAHHVLTELDPDDCTQDLIDSRTALEDLFRQSIPHVAYPRGQHDRHVRRAATKAGHAYAFSLPEGREPITDLSVPRVGIYRHNGLNSVHVKSLRSYPKFRTGKLYLAADNAAKGFAQRRDRPSGRSGSVTQQ